jgi:hypothetical protein
LQIVLVDRTTRRVAGAHGTCPQDDYRVAVHFARRDMADLSRSVGGLLFTLGAVVLFLRKVGHHEWGGFSRLLVVLVPAVSLYLLTLLGVRKRQLGDAARSSQTVLGVTSVLLWPVVFFQFLGWIGAGGDPLYAAAVFALTSLLAAFVTARARVAYGALLAGLSLLVAWLYLWQKILGHPSGDTTRWLLLAGAVLLLCASAWLARAKAIGAGELATTGGVAAVAAGMLGVIVGGFASSFGRLNRTLNEAPRPIGSSARIVPRGTPGHVRAHMLSHHAPAQSLTPHVSGLQHFGWDLYLLIVSLILVWIGSRARIRGLGYAGGAGLLAFIASVAAQITRLEAERQPTGDVVGWPLALLVIGLMGLAVSSVHRREG